MFDQIGRMLFALWSNDFSRLFSIVIVVYLVFALLLINSTNTKIRTLVSNAPGALTSLGILGTFVGIFIGLLDFNIQTINRSVPGLLEGLKVAFGTSILGLFAAVLFRLISPVITRESVGREDASGNDIVDHLMQLDTSINKATEVNSAGFEDIRNALTDDEDSSIVGQLQRLRTSVEDLESTTRYGVDTQIKEFKDFAEHISEVFSKTIIDELQNVIREFNQTLSEQFGENFKQLNVAVARLVDWQEEYRQQMSELEIALDNAVEGIKESQKSLSDIEVSASRLPDHLAKMEQANSALNSQLEKLEESLGGFAEMRDKAVNAFSEIEKNIENITVYMSATVERQTDVVKEIAENCASLITLQQESIADQRNVQREMLEGLQTSFNETISNATGRMNDTIIKLDEAMRSEMESVIRAITENLSGMSDKFVGDYTPLLETTRRILEIGERDSRNG